MDMSAHRIAILGGGRRGAGWAARFVLNGWDVALFDPDPEAGDTVRAVLDRARRTLPALADLPMPDEGRLVFLSRISETVGDVSWIVECGPERLDLKRKLYQQVQAHCDPEATIAAASGRFTAALLQGCATRAEQIVLAAAQTPVYLLPLVEVSGGAAAPAARIEATAEMLRSLGMAPVVLRREAEGNISGRLHDTLLREALWLVAEGIATPDEVDAVLRLGPGPAWAQAGLFELLRLDGGAEGLRGVVDRLREDLAAPRSHFADVPALTGTLAEALIAGTATTLDAAARDSALVGILRALKDRDIGAGQALNHHDRRRATPGAAPPLRPLAAPLVLTRLQVLPSWIDYNGHMTESRYLFACSETTDAFLRGIGADLAYVAGGFSYYTVESHLRHHAEARLGDGLTGTVQILGFDTKRLHLFVRILRDNVPMATVEQMLLHVNAAKGHAAPAPEHILERLRPLAAAHADLPRPDDIGRHVGQPRHA